MPYKDMLSVVLRTLKLLRDEKVTNDDESHVDKSFSRQKAPET